MSTVDQVEPNMTKVERGVLEMLENMGADVVVKPKIKVELFGKRRRLTPDFFVPAERLIVEAYGCFVHGCEECYSGQGSEEKRYRDMVRLEAFQRAGYQCEIIWEHEITDDH